MISNERGGGGGHSEYLEGVDLVRLRDVLAAVKRWNEGDRGTCKCPSCSNKIRRNLIEDANRLLKNLGNDQFLVYNPKDKKIYWATYDNEENTKGEAE